MSLKAFHIVFVILSVLTSLLVGGLFVRDFLNSGSWVPLAYSIGFFLFAVGLVIYGRYVLKKLKHISYL